jgi:hypothetical protein
MLASWEELMALPPMVPLIVAELAVVGAVSVAVYVPSPLSVTVEREPAVVPSVTVPPLEVRSLPAESTA